MGLGLLGGYIGWLNAPDDAKGDDILAYLFGTTENGSETDPSVVRSDSPGIWNDSPLAGTTLAQDSSTDLWDTEAKIDTARTDNAQFQAEAPSALPSPLPPVTNRQVQVPAVREETSSDSRTYQISAGQFKSRKSAKIRISELRQGNYPARLVEPNASDGYYDVVVGEYTDYARAKSKAREIGFILEIKATVEEKIRP